jgi:hypothetical protein
MWGTAALLAAIFAVGGLLLDLLSTKSKDHAEYRVFGTIAATVVTFLVLFFYDWVVLYTSTPVFAGVQWWGMLILPSLLATLFWFAVANWANDRVSLAPVGAFLGIIVLLVTCIWQGAMPLRGASDIYGRQAQVKVEPIGDYPPTNDNNIVTVSDQNALNKAHQAMGQKIAGSNVTVGSRYQLGTCDLQSVQQHMYYICSLALSGTANNRADKYTIPGYIVVDAQDPNAAATLRQGYHLRYSPGAPFSASLTRHIYNNGYSGYYPDDLTLEVNDRWEPLYTETIDQPAYRWQQSIPVGFIVADPQSGAITRYSLDKVPTWVDRVYSKTMAKSMLNWWGEWGTVSWNIQGSGGRYKVDGDVTLVYTDQGPAWQALMTSKNNDTSISYVALMDTRSRQVRMYTAPQGLTTQDTVTHAIDTSGSNLKGLDPVDMALHEIYGELVWVAPLVPNGTAGTNPEPSAGLALLSATDPNGSSVIIGKDKADALQQLSTQIANGDNNSAPGASSNVKSVSGVIAKIGHYNASGGLTYVVITLKGDSHFYKGQITGDSVGNLELSIAAADDHVTIKYVDTGNQICNISSFSVDADVPTPSPTH